jgi:hypothetical protein
MKDKTTINTDRKVGRPCSQDPITIKEYLPQNGMNILSIV